MNLPIAFHRAARREYGESVEWYERRRAGLGLRFADAVNRVLARIASQPEHYPVIDDDVREACVPRFPYSVLYRVEPDRIVLVAVFHAARDPAIWRGRV